MIVKCPHCKEELQIPDRVYHNCEAYGGTNRSVTNCCGKLVNVRPIVKFGITSVLECELNDDEDDTDSWGIATWGYKRDKK